MSHEQSQTFQNSAGNWENVYGRGLPLAGQVLPPMQAYEQRSYPSVGEAESAAQLRSWLHGLGGGSHLLPAGSPPSMMQQQAPQMDPQSQPESMGLLQAIMSALGYGGQQPIARAIAPPPMAQPMAPTMHPQQQYSWSQYMMDPRVQDFFGMLHNVGNTPLSSWTQRPEDTQSFGQIGRSLLPNFQPAIDQMRSENTGQQL